MELKRLYIPLCDFRLQNCENRKLLASLDAFNQKTGNQQVDCIASCKGTRSKIYLSKQEDDAEEEPDFDSEKDDAEEDPDFDSEEDDVEEDPDFNPEAKVEKCSKRKSTPEIVKKKEPLSAYEQMIQKNRAEKMAFLQSIKMDEAKAGLSEIIERMKPIKHKRKCEQFPLVLRKSKRLENFSFDFSEESLYREVLEPSVQERIRKSAEMTFKEALESEEVYERFKIDVDIQNCQYSEANLLSYDKSVLDKLNIREMKIAKVTPSTIISLAWYPSPKQMIVACGDYKGVLGIWNVDSESNPYVFKNQESRITHLQFSPFDHAQLISSSSDGILCCGDMVHHKFNEIYNASDKASCTFFDILSATTYVVGHSDGKIALVDKRTKSKSYKKMRVCHGNYDNFITTLNIHPVNKNYFVTAARKGLVCLWDLRTLHKKPVGDINYEQRNFSAFFSPVTGNSLLVSSKKCVSIFDTTELWSGFTKMKKKMTHPRSRKYRILDLSATWLPNSEKAFMVRNSQCYQRFGVFDTDMQIYSTLMEDIFSCIMFKTVYHPMRPALAASNNIGKVHVYK